MNKIRLAVLACVLGFSAPALALPVPCKSVSGQFEITFKVQSSAQETKPGAAYGYTRATVVKAQLATDSSTPGADAPRPITVKVFYNPKFRTWPAFTDGELAGINVNRTSDPNIYVAHYCPSHFGH